MKNKRETVYLQTMQNAEKLVLLLINTQVRPIDSLCLVFEHLYRMCKRISENQEIDCSSFIRSIPAIFEQYAFPAFSLEKYSNMERPNSGTEAKRIYQTHLHCINENNYSASKSISSTSPYLILETKEINTGSDNVSEDFETDTGDEMHYHFLCSQCDCNFKLFFGDTGNYRNGFDSSLIRIISSIQ